MHPYLFFYLLGGLTLIPVIVLVTVAVLWISLPTLDTSKPRPTDLPSAQSLREQLEKGNGSATFAKLTATDENAGYTLRRRVSAKLQSRSKQLLQSQSRSSSSVNSGLSATSASAPAQFQGADAHAKGYPGDLDEQDHDGDIDNEEHDDEDDADDKGDATTDGDTVSKKAARQPDVLMQADPNLNKEGYVRMTRVPRLGPATESISDYMSNMLFQPKNTRPKDSYYAVLRYDTLFLYESDQQRDCKSVVPMNLYEVKIFPKNLPDNEVFNKEHPIQIKRKADAPTSSSSVMDNGQDEYYIFIHTPVVKEDWYLALLYASKLRKPGTKQKIQDKAQFDQEAILNHIHILHSDKHHEHTRWFNSFLGRIFLGVYKTQKIRDIFIQKITRKTLKLKRPSFLGEIKVRSFDVGHSIPYITRTRLHELALNGELTAEFHLAYRGGVRVEIEVDVGIGLASLKPVKVTIVLAVLVKAISGMMTLKIKAPPTNRFWIGFQEAPTMDIVIEPIVADKAIKLNMVLSAIEAKIREAMMEAIVLPNMDDYPFFDSKGAGGIFEGDEDISTDQADDSDTESTHTSKTGSKSQGKVASGRRGSESSFNSDHVPPTLDGADRKLSWSSTGTDSDADPESLPIASTPPKPSLYLNHQHNSSFSSTASNANAIANTMAAKFKRFSQAHFSTRSTESLADSAKLNTKPTVATSIATAIRTPPSGAPHSNNAVGGNSSKLQSALPKLSSLNDAATDGGHGPRIFSSSPANGPSKKDSSNSLRRLATLESPTSDDSESGSSDDNSTPTGNDPVCQSLGTPVQPLLTSSLSVSQVSSRSEYDTSRKDGLRKWDTAPATRIDKTGVGEEEESTGVPSSSSSHVGIAGILEGSRPASNSVSGTALSVQGNLASLFSNERKKRSHSRNSSANVEADQDDTSHNNDLGSGGTGYQEHSRRNSGDSLLSLKLKKDLLLKKITSHGSSNNNSNSGGIPEEGREGQVGSSSRSSISKFSLEDIKVGGLLGHRRRGSVPSATGNARGAPSPLNPMQRTEQQQQEDLASVAPMPSPSFTSRNRTMLERTKSSGSASSTRSQDRELYPLGRPFENSSSGAAVEVIAPISSSSPSVDLSQLPPAPSASISFSPSISSPHSGGSAISSRSAYLQQKSQAALGATKAWVKRSLEDRRVSEDDPLLSGKMRLD
ncbi:hypothetical protein EMPS_04818 [Entomortierella parvispora]|uniref:SMP-LTD domain-containing protein n=1 Tax=Entomortierella parvispora TaxID=205924 RepID=A0A9P3LVR6_9FUNG|nr:hypothetical protein EMPS_04818 [Entomortierella parvispora]